MNKFNDFKDILKKNSTIDPAKYTSGTIFKAFNIKMPKDHKIHNSFNDVNSIMFVNIFIINLGLKIN